MKFAENLSIRIYPNLKEMYGGQAAVYVKITVTGSPAREFSSGLKTHIGPEHWNTETMRFVGSEKEISLKNKRLDQIQAAIEKHHYFLSQEYEVLTSELVRDAYKGKLNEKRVEDKKPAKTLCQVFNFKYSQFAHQVRKQRRANTTLRKWRTTKRKIRNWLQNKYKKWDRSICEFELYDAQDFMDYLILVEDLEECTARKYIKNTKELFEIACVRKWLPSNPWEAYKIKADFAERDILTMYDICSLYNHQFSGRLEYIRDITLFAIFTGYSYCELDRFQKSDIFLGDDGSRWIKIDRKKTGNPELMPLLPIPAAIVDKYWNDPYCVQHGKLLPLRSYQHYNGYLKELAGICQLSIEPTPHVLRHTFATTICLDNGVPMETVMRLLGHRNIRTTQIYAKVTRKKLAHDISELEKKLFAFDGKLVQMEPEVIKLIEMYKQKQAV